MALRHPYVRDMFDREEEGLLPSLLAGTARLYGGVVSLRNRLCDNGIITRRKLPRPVVSVGNITVGGTGKTPMVILLSRMLKEQGMRPAVLSRGYAGRRTKGVSFVSNGRDILLGPEEAGDEPVLIARSCPGVPVIIGKDRYRAGLAAHERFHPDVFILDDAFQHRRLFRHVDLVLIDRERPVGNGYLLPRGPLRESPKGLSRATLIVETASAAHRVPAFAPDRIRWTGGWFPPVITAYRRPTGVVHARTGMVQGTDCLDGKRVLVFTGIARPEHFFATVESLGATLVARESFPDHYAFGEQDMRHIRGKAASASADMIVTTEKDGVKLVDFQESFHDMYFLRIAMEIVPDEQILSETIRERIL